MNDSLESRIELMVARSVEAAQADRLAVRRSRTGQDLVITIELTKPEPHRLTLRVEEGGVLLDVDATQLGFSASVFGLFRSGRKEWRRIG